ncbi:MULTISPECIES: MarR family winged helix-turn-helix transcriptional regulator [Psychrilyobacter]|uniref:Winged helix-turn-helix transcriptional regulator n=1 Tax=Psychrilyobacter piezotolerans TaxID=2293438 RepID=A0ABX9KFW0_9FUSO|nr:MULTISPECIES: MarR family transcriptional regulator [Psychrilyobacter]MCS5420918.1 winged helix-turn-helix transcriptional regulator [Psychrilyobacter sp. S5]NDI78521.1 winged helix-turn-helix transcriptional regulator [Psychrilyobacter piezotolerans]RDE60470.1 winged helix-turn-helix transcriptional regulator [Psychrilyobacter sp. S5]REI40500.1 winged helix-turn-helix transcriptional regulator [Psychrilyobacter piezotolerans]
MFSKYISITYRQYQHYMREELKKYKIGNSDYPILLCLINNPGICQNEVSRLTKLNKSLISKGVKKLIQYEYLYQEEDTHHKQKQKLFLTKNGKKIIPDLKDIITRWKKIVFKDLTEPEIEILYKVMKTVDQNSMAIK